MTKILKYFEILDATYGLYVAPEGVKYKLSYQTFKIIV